jgi:hypothetical protein
MVRGLAASEQAALRQVVRAASQSAGVEFIEENGGGPGVRLKKPPKERT